MKKLIIGLCVGLFCSYSYAAQPTCYTGSCLNIAYWDNSIGAFMGCNGPTCTCLEASGTTTYACGCYQDSDCQASGYGCVKNTCQVCKTCSNCTTTAWVNVGTGYQSRTNASCGCDGICTKTTQYRCAAGYYGMPTSTSSGCYPCPSPGTSESGSLTSRACYVSSGATGSDSTGSYTYT